MSARDCQLFFRGHVANDHSSSRRGKFLRTGSILMPSFTTIYRTVVMAAAGIIIIKAWQVWGPTGDQMWSIAHRAAEIAQEAGKLSNHRTDAAQHLGSATPDTPLLQEPAGGAMNAANTPRPGTWPADAAINVTQDNFANVASQSTSHPAFPVRPEASVPSNTPTLPAVDGDRLSMLMSRLEKLGVIDPHLAKWGMSGKLYRFRCQATLVDNPRHTRHFESVASEPVVAVEDVVAKVAAWRKATGDRSPLR
jgi:hypothetical protein